MSPDARTVLLAGLIDYAGLFPPARLPLSEAMQRYDRHHDGPDAAMLGRFILPGTRRDALAPWLGSTWHRERPLRLSLLADNMDLARLVQWAAAEPSVRLEALELKPAAGSMARVWLEDILNSLLAIDLDGTEVYVELVESQDEEMLACLAQWQGRHALLRLGAKLRCGGITADLVPEPDRVAAVLAAAADGAVPLKFTAGLHHPLRGMDQTEGVPMHGFLNVYGAGLLAHTGGLSAAQLGPVLAETDPRAFRLTAADFAWRDQAVPAAAVADLRSRLLGGYGSCSFTEPVSDLRALGLLA